MRISDWSSDVCSSDLHLQCFGNAALTGTPGRNRKVAEFTIRKEQLLKRGARALLNSMPFGRRHEPRSFDTSLGEHLRALCGTSPQQSATEAFAIDRTRVGKGRSRSVHVRFGCSLNFKK